jgi:hypothetical protein
MGATVIYVMDQETLEEAMTEYITRRGFRRVQAQKIDWKTRKGITATVFVEQQIEQPPAAPLPEPTERGSKRRDPTVKLDPGMFPDPAAAQALMEAAVSEDNDVLYPNENSRRQGEVQTLQDLKDNPFLPPRGAGR